MNLLRCHLWSLIFNKYIHQNIVCLRTIRILGIETSCDDTGAAVIDDQRNILGESIRNQLQYHQKFGGIVPNIAKQHHYENLVPVVAEAMNNIEWDSISAIATSIRPGLIISLWQGVNFTRQLLFKYNKPFIPIHHMEAHALTVRLTHDVDFPYMVLLASGGHCILAIVEDVDKYYRLGESNDISPGETLDKVAREMNLSEHPSVKDLVGGAAIEYLALQGDSSIFNLITSQYSAKSKDCSFTFGGMLSAAKRLITKHQIKYDSSMLNDQILKDLCACIQTSVVRHIETRIHRAILYCDYRENLTWRKTLVLSGGVASNLFLRKRLKDLCDYYSMKLVCPPPKYCTDNGVMIAWNGVERFRRNLGVISAVDEIIPEARSPLGENISEHVRNVDIHVPFDWEKVKKNKKA
ncbi:unnamed protein product [Didymodactylos carnosus]|uniref:N(6)-L-threonylcarbamoyladenine synthase n=1 Tax=Didymodactylos carnosus TaxID=1234261 RepID=A0A814XKU0_9BILA|nr:unnamed protein product [Didymodactylos carnosus]CAF1216746.1 unnamed protein product [Didymodactylos carnosus]CAF3587583.1 unnamed protein product [Didymodactylos carnosus]CAF3980484.1 unnamed protein product [Didymodactylos carnosus]